MAIVEIEVIVRELLVKLKACSVLKTTCRSLSGFLLLLLAELACVNDSDEVLLQMEATLNQLKQVLGCMTQKRRGKLSKAVLFFLSRKKAMELSECHMKLIELLEQLRTRQNDPKGHDMKFMKSILEQFEEQSRKDNQADLNEDRTAFLNVLEEEAESDEEVAELFEIVEKMNAVELDTALKSVSRVKLLMENIATRTEMEGYAIQANIPLHELTIYEDDILGNGSFGGVLAGILRGKPVAIKRALAMSMMSFQAQDDLRKEAQKWQTLDHSNIVRLLGTSMHDNYKFLLVMERCDITLFDLLYKRTELLSNECFEAIATGILRGLTYLHSKQYIHRDLKPMNVLLRYDQGSVKLSDFGLLTAKEEYATYAKTSTVRGTWLYMAPEVLDTPAQWTTRADMYSFALVCWEILHREIPWGPNVNPIALGKKLARGERPGFSESIEFKQWQIQLIQSCWDQEPRNRPRAGAALAMMEEMVSPSNSTKVIKDLLSFLKKQSSSSKEPQLESERKDDENVSDLSLRNGKPGESDVERAVQVLGQSDKFRTGLKLLLGLIASEHYAIYLDSDQVKSLRKAAWRQGASAVLMQFLCSPAAVRETDDLRTALRALGFLMQTEDNEACAKELEKKYGAGQVVLQLVRAFPGKAEILAEGFFALSRIASDVDNAKALMQMGTAEVILQAMRTHASHAGVQGFACWAIRNLALKNDDNLVTLMQMGVAEAILQAMRTHSSHARVQEAAFLTLLRLAVHDDNRVTLMQMGAAEVILQAMRTLASHAGVQEYACGALSNLAANADNKVTLMRMGAADAILQAMRTHSSHAGIQAYACGAIGNLASIDSCVTLMQMGAAEVILQAMRTLASHADVQEYACGALLNLAANADNKVTLMRMGAADAILQAMRTHSSHAGIQAYACGAIGNLASNDNNCVTLMRMGAADAILQAMHTHASHADVQRSSCRAIGNLALNDDNCVTLMQMGAAEAILQAMRTHAFHADVQQYACHTIGDIAVYDGNCVTLMQMGAAEAILQAMRTHASHADVQKNACRTFGNLALNDDNRVTLMQMGAAEAILQAMRTYSFHAVVQVYACRALLIVSINVTVKEKLKQLGALDLAIRAKTCHSDDSEVCSIADELIKILNTMSLAESLWKLITLQK